jgi:hypothetical protein
LTIFSVEAKTPWKTDADEPADLDVAPPAFDFDQEFAAPSGIGKAAPAATLPAAPRKVRREIEQRSSFFNSSSFIAMLFV